MKITSTEIAKLANVSRATVYRVINKKPNVRPDTLERVNAVIDKYGYTPNTAGQALVKQNREDTIGVILPSISNDFYLQIQEGINAFIKEYEGLGVRVVCEYMDSFSVDNEIKAIQKIKENGVDALAIVAIDDERVIEELNSINNDAPIVPFVSDVDCNQKLCFVGNEQRKCGSVAAEIFSKIMSQGKIIVVSTALSLVAHKDRVAGFSEYLKKHTSKISIHEKVIENYDSDNATYSYLKEILDKEKDITGIYFTTGQGIAGYKALIEEIDYPCKIKVVASDLLPITKEMLKEGTVDFTICQQPFEEGYLSLKTIYEYLTKKIIPNEKAVYTNVEIKGYQNS